MAKRFTRAPGIYELEPGVYKVVVSRGRDAQGRYRQQARTVRGTLGDAKAARARLLTEASDRRFVAAAPVSFGAVLDRWLEHVEFLGRSPTTVATYRVVVRRHLKPALGAKPIANITTLDLDTLYETLARSRKPATVAKVHAVARGAFTQALRWQLIAGNPALDASVPPSRRLEPRAATPHQVRRLVDGAEEDFATLLVLAATTGMRRGELCGLTWDALDLPDDGPGTVSVHQVVVHGADGRAVIRSSTKAGRSRRISLDPATVSGLREHRQRCEDVMRECGGQELGAFVFSPAPDNAQPYQPHTITQRFARLCARVGIEGLTLHQSTRHFAATQLIAGGVDVRTVAGRLGHSRASITLDVYSHLVADRDDGAAALLGAILHASE